MTINSKIVKQNIPKFPQLAFKEDCSGVLAIASRKSTTALNAQRVQEAITRAKIATTINPIIPTIPQLPSWDNHNVMRSTAFTNTNLMRKSPNDLEFNATTSIEHKISTSTSNNFSSSSTLALDTTTNPLQPPINVVISQDYPPRKKSSSLV